jgi:hypothetical protein
LEFALLLTNKNPQTQQQQQEQNAQKPAEQQQSLNNQQSQKLTSQQQVVRNQKVEQALKSVEKVKDQHKQQAKSKENQAKEETAFLEALEKSGDKTKENFTKTATEQSRNTENAGTVNPASAFDKFRAFVREGLTRKPDPQQVANESRAKREVLQRADKQRERKKSEQQVQAKTQKQKEELQKQREIGDSELQEKVQDKQQLVQTKVGNANNKVTAGVAVDYGQYNDLEAQKQTATVQTLSTLENQTTSNTTQAVNTAQSTENGLATATSETKSTADIALKSAKTAPKTKESEGQDSGDQLALFMQEQDKKKALEEQERLRELYEVERRVLDLELLSPEQLKVFDTDRRRYRSLITVVVARLNMLRYITQDVVLASRFDGDKWESYVPSYAQFPNWSVLGEAVQHLLSQINQPTEEQRNSFLGY